ncbi:GNAT family N-acetyltransferase [Candidatus Uabimicrobium amorphum]|uniref:N-acetyltransferase GCN5 n=1 Tax=Uabimicrobium amorphum TaxID=2596890 RepID=A0A5S9ILG0_UABAM|nr:GNAT family N-acetyltransferase [Candidatus Uabimicrobium amorphum]BBM83512.1 N-acetyltransferase GCN5 [Candidatus Uabimicrobium amorphum]
MSIRDATLQDVEQISHLVITSVIPHKNDDFTETAWRAFEKSNDYPTTKNRLANPNYFTLCYEKNQEILGIITIKKYESIDQLYVLPKAWQKGIAKQLWAAAKKRCLDKNHSGAFRVISSTYAMPVYKSFGFVPGDRQTKDGICFYRMTHNIKSD